MDPISEIRRLDLQTVIDSMYGVEQQQLRKKILLETATHEEIIANYENCDPLHEVFGQEWSRAESKLLLEHYDTIAFANYLGGLMLLYDTSPTASASRDIDNTQKAVSMMARLEVPESAHLPLHVDHRIIDLHNAYAGTTNNENIRLLDPADSRKRLIGAQSLRSGIADMDIVSPWRPVTPSEKVSFNLALQATGGVVFGSMFRLLVDKYNYDGSIHRENLSQLLQSIKLYAAPTLSQTDEAYAADQRRDFGMACIVLGKALEGCSTSDLKNALVKGDLHEVLWLLDSFALLKGNPKKYGQLGIVAADYAEDRGNIKNLALKRGHDFRVHNRDTQQGTFTQLKSHASRRHDKPYAESIAVHREQDFHKLIQNPTLITDKLRQYTAWSQANFDTEMFITSGLESAVMPTVKEVFDGLVA